MTVGETGDNPFLCSGPSDGAALTSAASGSNPFSQPANDVNLNSSNPFLPAEPSRTTLQYAPKSAVEQAKGYNLLQDRRQLLEYVLKAFQTRGGKLSLPTGMAAPDPWLLDSINVRSLLVQLQTSTHIELAKMCSTPPLSPPSQSPAHSRSTSQVDGPMSATNSSRALAAPQPIGGSARLLNGSLSDAMMDMEPPMDANGNPLPQLDLPQLGTDLAYHDVRDLAFMLFVMFYRHTSGPSLLRHGPVAATPSAAGPVAPTSSDDLIAVVRRQLRMDETRANQIVHVFKLVGDGWSPAAMSSLELHVKLMEVVRPKDFDRFKHFLRWKDTTTNVMLQVVGQAVRENWQPAAPYLDASPAALTARLKGALRRMDVRSAEEYDPGEYGEAALAMSAAARTLAACCRSGWQFPWGLRVRVVEVLLGCVFDRNDEGGAYIPEAEEVLEVAVRRLWPALGVSAPLHSAVFTWTHFTQLLRCGGEAGGLMLKLKKQIKQLAAYSGNAGGVDGSLSAAPSADSDGGDAAAVAVITPADRSLSSEVGSRIITWISARLSDYWTNFPAGQQLEGMLEVFTAATQARGDDDQQRGGLLVAAINSSLEAEFERRLGQLTAATTEAAQLLAVAAVVRSLQAADTTTYTPIIARCLPGCSAVTAYRLHALYARRFCPWAAQVDNLEQDTLELLRTCLVLEPELEEAMSAPQLPGSGSHPAVAAAVAHQMPWGTVKEMQRLLLGWTSKQYDTFNLWMFRQLQAETWRPLGPGQPYASSAVEAARMLVASLELLFEMGLPLPPEIINMHMEGIDSLLQNYVKAVLEKEGPLSRLIPPLPPLTRFKKDVVKKQEDAETTKPKDNKKKPDFLESVPRVETSLDAGYVSQHLSVDILVVLMCSLHYLLERCDMMQDMVRQRWDADRWRRASGGGGTAHIMETMLDTARQSLSSGIAYTVKFLANKVTFWDLRQQWLELLYRHHVVTCDLTMERLCAKLSELLGYVCGQLPTAGLRDQMAAALYKTSLQALERVLLEGGPCRWFITDDVKLIEADLARLKALFAADGQGLKREVLDGDAEVVAGLLRGPMKLETGPLMDALKQTKTKGTVTIAGQEYDEGVLMKVLSHRPDRMGSKLLKKDYKLSKRIK